RKLLEGTMRGAGGFHERIVKLPHCFGEEFSCLRTGHRGTAGRAAKDGTDNLSDGVGIDPALLQNLARQRFDAFADRLVFDGGTRGICCRYGGLWHVMLRGCLAPWLLPAIAKRISRRTDRKKGHAFYGSGLRPVPNSGSCDQQRRAQPGAAARASRVPIPKLASNCGTPQANFGIEGTLIGATR